MFKTFFGSYFNELEHHPVFEFIKKKEDADTLAREVEEVNARAVEERSHLKVLKGGRKY